MATFNGKSALVVFLDLEKAYELASSDAILTSLVIKGIRGHLLAWTQKYTQNREATVTFLAATLSPTPEITLLKHKANSRLNTLRRITSLNQGATHHILRLFYVQAVRSLVEYAAPVLTTLSPTQEKTIKALCPPAQAFRAALDLITLTLADNVYYTDGSVDREVSAAAAAVYSPHFLACWRISNNVSTLQTELVGILKALTHSLTSQGNTTIHTDSRGAMTAIRSQDIQENTLIISSIRQIAHTHALQNRQVTLNWIPSHIGILGIEESDRLAKQALQTSPICLVKISKIVYQHYQPCTA
ncbi:uncharacterized protein [Palaemon carinicauda]|uniref:uncharacterized protein n=1 Tax=Palaemon carinicauda TaxID=392227 RepID=UPI0035B637A4